MAAFLPGDASIREGSASPQLTDDEEEEEEEEGEEGGVTGRGKLLDIWQRPGTETGAETGSATGTGMHQDDM